MNYVGVNAGKELFFDQMHQIEWEKKAIIDQRFALARKQFFLMKSAGIALILIYFDAFWLSSTARLWSTTFLKKCMMPYYLMEC
jgi:hypothetical protein